MGYKNREIESKLEIRKTLEGPVPTMKLIDKAIEKAFEDETKDFVEGTSNDVYWTAPTNAPADFGRVREMSDGRCQITAKGKDKGDNLDRIEVDLEIFGTTLQAVRFMESMIGASSGVIRKTYYVYILENEHTTVSIYKVFGDERVFVEVEARNRKRMLQMEQTVIKAISDANMEAVRAGGSLFEMFIKKGGSS